MSEIDWQTPRPREEWTEEDGPVMWWRFPIEEPPYVGTPNDTGRPVLIETTARYHHRTGSEHRIGLVPVREDGIDQTIFVGGWPGYHTHWTPIPIPATPAPRGVT